MLTPCNTMTAQGVIIYGTYERCPKAARSGASQPPSLDSVLFLHLQWYFDMETTSEKSYISLG